MRTAFVCLLAAGLLGGCKAGSTPDGGPIATPTQAVTYNVPPEISAQQLQSITLALADFGPRYGTFQPSLDSEMTATIERSLDSCDPLKEQGALSNYGWTKAYARTFIVPDESPVFDSVSVGTVVDVYSTPENAATKIRYDSKQIYQDQKAPGGCQGLGIERIEEMGLPQIGDQMWAVRVHFAAGVVRGLTHIIAFRRDRVVATVSITRFNSEDSAAEVHDLAKKLDERLLTMITAPLSITEPAERDGREF